MHDNWIVLFFIETGRLRCILIYTCINYPLPGLVYMFCLHRVSSIFESAVQMSFLCLFDISSLTLSTFSKDQATCTYDLVGICLLNPTSFQCH